MTTLSQFAEMNKNFIFDLNKDNTIYSRGQYAFNEIPKEFLGKTIKNIMPMFENFIKVDIEH